MFKTLATVLVLGGFMFHIIATDGLQKSSCIKLEKELIRVSKAEGGFRNWTTQANMKAMKLGTGDFTKAAAKEVNDRLPADVSCTLGLFDVVVNKLAKGV